MEQERREMKPPPVQPSENTPPPTPPPQKCPRCDSPNMKFCYYNNYSTSQPRYFCKACRRYWTHGGTLRNVPVGGGCRRPKRARPLSYVRADSLTPQLAQPVSAPHFSNVEFSSSFAQPQATFQVGNSSARLSFSPFDQQPQNQRQTEFYQMANHGLVEANRVLSFLNQTLEDNNNNNNNNNNNGSNPNPNIGTSFNFLSDFPDYGHPSS